jgi:hypothetical protein
MLRGLFPRVFSNFRECGIVHAKFVKSGGGSPVYTLKSSRGLANYQGLTLVTAGTGLATLTLVGGARSIAPLDMLIKGQSALIGTSWKVHIYAITESTGAMSLKFSDSSATEAIAALADNDEVWVTLMVDK